MQERLPLVLFIGLQASGKTSFFTSRFAQTHVHISKDKLRNNPWPERRQEQLIRAALGEAQSVVVDNTHPTREERARLIGMARELGAGVVGYYFASDVQDCLERNRLRSGKERVPDVALYSTIKKMRRPALDEGFDALYYVRLLDGGEFEVLEWDDQEQDG